ncbi:MAG: MG2 domain-containing protein, partial [Gammaproteobacteria bacterium]|nr:MG2 domain-containing protein [Gammaproteobacteria bacterium]
THPVDEASLQDHLSYAMRAPGTTVNAAAERVAYEITYDKHRRKAFIHSAVVEIPAEETYLTMHLTEGLAASSGPSRFEQELLQNVRIPDIASYFRVSDVQSLIVRNENDEPEQTVIFEFTDRVNTDALQQRLQAFLLPRSVVINGRTRNNKRWSSPREVTPDILTQAEEIEFELNPAEHDIAQFHSLRVDVPEDRDVYLKIAQGLRSAGDFVMSLPYDTVVRSATYPKEATIAQSGALLPLTGEHRLTFLSRGVETLKVEVGRLIDSDVNHLASQTGGDIKSPYFNNYLFNEDNLTTRSTRFIDLNVEHPKTAVYSNLDLSEFLPDGGYYFISVQGWDRRLERAVGGRDQRFILITDLGLLVKSNADSSQDVFVHSIATGKPVAGARVELLGKNGVAIIDRVTGVEGHVEMPATKDFEREKSPTVFLVRAGQDSIFMPYARSGRMLQYSRFDVGGEQVRRRTDADRLLAQVFTDRGLYRPGDTARLASIVKRDDWAALGNLPLALNIRDPRGQTAMDKLLELPDDGFFEETFATDAASATGNYDATLYLVEAQNRRRAIGSATFKVEEFLPDRLRIQSSISGQKPLGWVKPGDLTCNVTLENLFGTPAESRRVTGQLELSPTSMRFGKYPGYVFDDPLRESGNVVRPVTQTLAPVTTALDGTAELALELGQYDKGIYRLTVLAEGFEEGGGRSVKAQASTFMSPLDYLIGYKTDSDLNFLSKDSEHSVHFLAVDSDANTRALTGLTLSIVAERFVSTLVKRPNGTYAYQSILEEETVSSHAYSLADQGGRFTLPTAQPGRFAVKIADSDGLVFSKVRYTVAGARNMAGNLERNAELDLVLDGTSFAPGAEIRMEITAPYTGTGLITIERDSVHAHKWFR